MKKYFVVWGVYVLMSGEYKSMGTDTAFFYTRDSARNFKTEGEQWRGNRNPNKFSGRCFDFRLDSTYKK